MRHGSDWVKVNLINTRKPEQECRASSGSLLWWSSWPKLRLPSFAPNRAPGDIGILSSISKPEMCHIILVLLVHQVAGGNHPRASATAQLAPRMRIRARARG